MPTGLVTRRGVVDFGMRSALGSGSVHRADRLESLGELDRCDVLLMDLLSCSDADYDHALRLADHIPVVVLVEWDAPSRRPESGRPGQLSLGARASTVSDYVTSVRDYFSPLAGEIEPGPRSFSPLAGETEPGPRSWPREEGSLTASERT